jgi:uncharacterized protein YndB with AHSA1/START domain
MSVPAVDVLRVSRVVPATPERVFRAWTTPEDMKRWWGRMEGFEVSNVEMDVRVGGRYRIEHSGLGLEAVSFGTYSEVSPSRRLAFTFAWEKPLLEATDTGETLVTVDLNDVDGGTEIVVVHERLRGPVVVSFHKFGWSDGFDRLEALMAAEE